MPALRDRQESFQLGWLWRALGRRAGACILPRSILEVLRASRSVPAPLGEAGGTPGAGK